MWLVALAGTFLILLTVTPCLPGGPRRFSDWVLAALFLLVFSFATATVLIGVWLPTRWLCCWRNFKRVAVVCVCLATLIASFYVEEDWRGWHAWKQFEREWESKGERFTLSGVVPPPVPDEQSFAVTEIAFTGYGQVFTRDGKVIPVQQPNSQFAARMRMSLTPQYPVSSNCAGDWRKGIFVSLEAWQLHCRELAGVTNEFPVPKQPQSAAADVLLALSRYDRPVEELRVASRLPDSRFPLNYDSDPWGVLLPHLAALRSCAQVLRLRSVAELENEQPDQALVNVRLRLQLADKIRTEPLLISHLVRVAMVQLMLQPIWEGLAKHRWSEIQLTALDQELLKLDFAAAWRLSMRGELAALSDSMQLLRRHPEKLRKLAELTDLNGKKFGPQLPGSFVARVIPAGWYYQNQFRCASRPALYVSAHRPGSRPFVVHTFPSRRPA